ncbi:MAG TPA: acyltransferase [Acidobacteriaceae bacterium]|nr:acyltransferase [Acidobacteriaceae bacterium]
MHEHKTDPQNWIKPYYRSFNGLRGLAVTLVFFCHYGGSLDKFTSQVGWVGVDLFFVLSGFLITGILFDSLDSPHYFRDFYVRRALRIFPIFYGFFGVLLIAALILPIHFHRSMLSFVFYVGNLVTPLSNLDTNNPTSIWIFRHGRLSEIANIGTLWSLCVEEQFYLIWPAIVWWVRDRSRLMKICILVSIATLGCRILLMWLLPGKAIWHYQLYCSTYTRCDTLLLGAWLALYLRGAVLSLDQLRRYSNTLMLSSLAGVIVGRSIWRYGNALNNRFILTGGLTLIALAAMGLVLRVLDDTSRISRVLRWPPIAGLGAISYGVYFFHSIPSPILHSFSDTHPSLRNIIPPVWFALTVSIAWLSFRFFETPFLRLKRVLAPHRASIIER